MTEFDDRLRGALSADDQAFLQGLEDERGLFAQMGDTLTGPLKYWTAFAFVLSLIFLCGTIYCAIRLSQAESLTETALWLAGFMWTSLAVAMVKLWFWLRMNHLATLRELKRMELRLLKQGV